jgi:hypothetical protein
MYTGVIHYFVRTAYAGGLNQLLRIDCDYITPEEHRHVNAIVRVAMSKKSTLSFAQSPS